MGWPDHDWTSGLTKCRRKALLSVMDGSELRFMVGKNKEIVEGKLKELLKMFGLQESDYSREDFVDFVNEAQMLTNDRETCEKMLAAKNCSLEDEQSVVQQWDYSHCHQNDESGTYTFKETGKKTMNAICSLSTSVGTTLAVLLQQNILLAPSLFLAHPNQTKIATVKLHDYLGSEISPIQVNLNPKGLFVCGGNAGSLFPYYVLELDTSTIITIEIISDEEDIENDETDSDSLTPTPLSLPVDSVVNLDCSPNVLFKIDSVEGRVLTISCLHTTHGLEDMPRGCGSGIVHRYGSDQSYTAVALNTCSADAAIKSLTSQKQNILKEIFNYGLNPISKQNDNMIDDATTTRISVVKHNSCNNGSYSKQVTKCFISCAYIRLIKGMHFITNSLTENTSSDVLSAADDFGNKHFLVFDLQWRFIGFGYSKVLSEKSSESTLVLHINSIISDMKRRGYCDCIRRNITQGDGLLDGKGNSSLPCAAAQSNRNKNPRWQKMTAAEAAKREMEAESLVWGDKGLNLNVPQKIPNLNPDDDEITLKVFAINMLGFNGEIDLKASNNVIVTIGVEPAGYTVSNNQTVLIRGVGVFYHLTISPIPKEEFRLVARVEIRHSGTIRYPLLRRHVTPVYNVMKKPPLKSDVLTCCKGVEMTELEKQKFDFQKELLHEPHPPSEINQRQSLQIPVKRTFSINYFSNLCKHCDGGLAAARMLSAMHQHDTTQNNGKMSTVLFGGNGFGPSLQASITRGANMIPLINRLGTDAAVLGVHDLDYGIPRFVDLIRRCEFPWLVSNVICSDTKKPIPGTVTTSILTIPDMVNFKIGLIGLVEEDWLLSSIQTESLTHLNPTDVTLSLSKSLRQSCDFIIVLSHMKLSSDVALAEATQGVVNLIVSGYSVVDGCQSVGKIPIIRNSCPNCLSYTRIEIAMIQSGDELPSFEIESSQINITTEYPIDPDLSEVTSQSDRQLIGLLDEVVVETVEDFNCQSDYVRSNETAIGNLLTDAILWTFRRLSCEVAILHSGCIRPNCTFEKGPLSMADIFSIVPTEDPIIVVEVRGFILKQLLEDGFKSLPNPSNSFPQTAGLRISLKEDNPPGSRVVQLSVVTRDGELEIVDFNNHNRMYKLATSAFLAYGRDGSTFLTTCRRRISVDEGVIIPSLFQNYLMNNMNQIGQIQPATSGRIQRK